RILAELGRLEEAKTWVQERFASYKEPDVIIRHYDLIKKLCEVSIKKPEVDSVSEEPRISQMQGEDQVTLARQKLKEAEAGEDPNHAEISQLKADLADALLADFKYDEGFQLLMELYKYQSPALGPLHQST